MSALRLWLCRLVGHRPFNGADVDTCITFHCERCRRLVPGGLASNN